jgi:tRNA-2-methylthio-N6-dimethylallyladenosine synthase
LSRCNQKKYYIITYGCQMNQRDTEIIKGYLENMDYCLAENESNADLIILNTCCVREKAEQKVFSKLGELKKLKQKRPELIIGVCGCMTQQDEVFKNIRKRTPYVDLILGTFNLHRFPGLLRNVEDMKETAHEIWDKERNIVENLPSVRTNSYSAYVNISYGCNNFCTYCIVPYVRGRERSRSPKSILEEIENLAKLGYKEIMLLGQNVNSYGKDLEVKMDFADLLCRINDLGGIERIRYMTSHPRDFSDKLIKTVAECDKVCEHYHLPIQAGSNTILKMMNRGYTREKYLELIDKIKLSVRHLSITSDIIVGFPNETEDDFLETLDIIKKVRFDAIYTFIYSPRKGTQASSMENQIPLAEKKSRLQRLMECQNVISLEKNNQLLETTQEVLVEGLSKTDANRLMGRTRTNKIVNFTGDNLLIGQLANVKITKSQTWNLFGELVN